jgi:hypothetical protein
MNWSAVVQNMPGAKWLVTVRRDAETVADQEVPFSETEATEGLLIGTVQPVHVLLPGGEGTPPTRIRVIAGSCHAFAAVLEGEAHCGRRPLLESYSRFDWRTLSIGPFEVEIYFRK